MLLKDRIAIEKGYPSYNDMYDWIARNGQIPHVVAQQIEAFMTEYFKRLVDETSSSLLLTYDEGDTSDRVSMAYIDGCKDVCKNVKENL